MMTGFKLMDTHKTNPKYECTLMVMRIAGSRLLEDTFEYVKQTSLRVTTVYYYLKHSYKHVNVCHAPGLHRSLSQPVRMTVFISIPASIRIVSLLSIWYIFELISLMFATQFDASLFSDIPLICLFYHSNKCQSSRQEIAPYASYA